MMSGDCKMLLERWRDQLDRSKSAQYLSAERCHCINNWPSIRIIVSTPIVGSTVVAILREEFEKSLWLKRWRNDMNTVRIIFRKLETAQQ